MIRIKYSPWLCQGVASRTPMLNGIATGPRAKPGGCKKCIDQKSGIWPRWRRAMTASCETTRVRVDVAA